MIHVQLYLQSYSYQILLEINVIREVDERINLIVLVEAVFNVTYD